VDATHIKRVEVDRDCMVGCGQEQAYPSFSRTSGRKALEVVAVVSKQAGARYNMYELSPSKWRPTCGYECLQRRQ
jgi:hypothetical protein